MFKNKELANSFYLFSPPSFLEGFGRIFDWSSSLNVYWYSDSENESDCLASKQDWRAVRDDFKTVIKSYGKQSVAAK
jgi:hypothetical protein